MEKAAQKKTSLGEAYGFLEEITRKSHEVVRTVVDKGGKVSSLAGPTVICTPNALSKGELTEAAKKSVRVEINPNEPILKALREPPARRTSEPAGSSGAKKSLPQKKKSTAQPQKSAAPRQPNLLPKKVAKSRSEGPQPPVRRESSSPEDRSGDLIRRGMGGKNPKIVAKALGGPSPGSTEGASRAVESMLESLEDKAVQAGARVSPFSEEEYNRTLMEEVERRATDGEVAVTDKAEGKRKVMGGGEERSQLKKAKPNPTPPELIAAVEANNTPPEEDAGVEASPKFVCPIDVPLYADANEAKGFFEFTGQTVVDGTHYPTSEIRESAVLTMHAANWLFRQAQAEDQKRAERKAAKQLLQTCQEKLKESEEKLKEYEAMINKLKAEKDETATLAQAQAHRLKQREEQLDRANQARAELEGEVLTWREPMGP